MINCVAMNESITQLMLSTSDVKVLGRECELSVKGAEKTIQQNEIGEKPDYCYFIGVLACNHKRSA